ncbi:MAG: peptidylprolyl isomerase [Bacilli bacterium]|nr:peptidylprolyl isomerase [Bacilli bacterium]
MKKLTIVLFATLLLVTGCKSIPKLADGKEAVVSFKDGGISTEELYEELKEKYALSVLINMIDTKILDEKYDTDSDAKNYAKTNVELSQTYYDQYYNQLYSFYEQFISENYGMTTKDELYDYFILRYKRNLAIKDYAKSLITEGDIKDYYDDELIGDIEASHILITAEYNTEDEKEAAEAEALKKAKDVIAQLDAGADFATLAKQYSKDGSASNGGELGRFGHGEMTPEFEKAAYKLEVGKYTKEPVKTQYGYHIILKTKQYEKPEFEDVKDEIIDDIADEMLNSDPTLQVTALEELRKDSGMSIEDSVLNTQYNNYIENLKR